MAKANRKVSETSDNIPETNEQIAEQSEKTIEQSVSEFQELVKPETSETHTPTSLEKTSEQISENNRELDRQKEMNAEATPGIGHNRPPGTLMEVNGVEIYVVNEAYIPGAVTVEALNAEISELHKEGREVVERSLGVRNRIIATAVDYLIIRANLEDTVSYTVNGTAYEMRPIEIDKNKPDQIEFARQDVREFLRNVFAYHPQEKFAINDSETKSQRYDGDNPTIGVADSLITEGCNAAILVYFGEFGFTLANFTPKGNAVVTAEEIAKGVPYVRKLAYDIAKVAPWHKLGSTDQPTAHGLMPCSYQRTSDLYQVFVGKKIIDRYGNVSGKKRAAKPVGQTTEETAEQKANREAAEKKADETALVKASEMIGAKPATEGEAKPTEEQEAIAKLNSARVICEALPASVRVVFSKSDKASHDYHLALAIAQGFKTLIERINTKADGFKKNVELRDCIAEIHMTLDEIVSSDIAERPL